MSYNTETIQAILPRINSSFFLPAMQREFVWTADQICELFDSLMRGYPISAFLFWRVPADGHDNVEAYEFLHAVCASGNRLHLARAHGSRDITFVLDGQQRLTSLLVGLQGSYLDRQTAKGRGARTNVTKKLYLDLLHDGRVPDADGDFFYKFRFLDYAPILAKSHYWFEVGRILHVDPATGIKEFVERHCQAIKDVRGALTSHDASIVEHNLTRLHKAIWCDDALSYHTETDSDHERILEIFVRANSGGTKLSKSDLLLSTLTLHWGHENAKEVINDFVEELNNKLTRRNKLTKDFVMKSCLVLLNLPVAYQVSSFTQENCAQIRRQWDDMRSALRRAADAANAFGIDERTLSSHNALIPIAFYLYQHPRLTLRGESGIEVSNAAKVRIWLLSALLNRVFGGSSDSILTKLRLTLQTHKRLSGDFPIAEVNETVRAANRIAPSNQQAVDTVMATKYGGETCFLALSLLYDDRNWGTIEHSIDHLFPQDAFKRSLPEHVKKLRDDFGNLALVIGAENAGKQNCPLHEWLATRSPQYLKRHFIPSDRTLWHFENYENFLLERRKLMMTRIQQVFSFVETAT